MSLECREKTMTCEEARRLTARQVAGEAVGSCDAQQAQHHLETCELCRLHLEELLAARLLQEAESPQPPQDLADSISSAALTYMRYQNRPMHQKALGSPAFFATCASLLCGAIICLLASLRVAAVPGVNAVAAPIARTSQDAAGDSGGTVLPVQPDAALAAYSRATGYVTELLMSLPGGERPASLVAFYPRRPALVSLRSSGPARLQPTPIGRARETASSRGFPGPDGELCTPIASYPLTARSCCDGSDDACRRLARSWSPAGGECAGTDTGARPGTGPRCGVRHLRQ